MFTVGLATWVTEYIFYRQDIFVCMNDCAIANIIQPTAYMVITMIYFTMCSVMAVSYIIITVKLKQRNSMFATSANDANSKMTKASWLTLGAFIFLYTPSIVLALVPNFMPKPTPVVLSIILDVSFLLYYLNNVINPFLYFATLSTFREGYTCLLTFRGIPEPQKS